MSKTKKIIIIGAGVAGLSAGIYARKNGYEVEIFEMHSKPGGVCTGWKKQGYYFDGCIHWLVGSGKNKNFSTIWEELGVYNESNFIFHENICRVVNDDRSTFYFPADIEKLEKKLLTEFSDDTFYIKELCDAIKLFQKLKSPEKPFSLMNIFDIFKLIKNIKPFMKTFKKFNNITVGDFVANFKSLDFAKYLSNIVNEKEFPLLALLVMLSSYSDRNAGWPIGGSDKFSIDMEKYYLSLGGVVRYNSKIEKIIVQDKKACGIVLNKNEHFSDIVVSACDGYSTIYKLLEGNFRNKKIDRLYQNGKLWTPLVMVSIGLKVNSLNISNSDIYLLNKERKLGVEKVKELWITNFAFDKTLNNGNKTSISIVYSSSFEYWEKLYLKKEKYRQVKKQVENDLLQLLEELYPGINSQVDVVDIATPVTTYRFTGNRNGSFEGWLFTTKNFGKEYSKKLPGLKNFFMTGQWVVPGGGLPTAAKSSRDLIQIICKNDKQTFIA